MISLLQDADPDSFRVALFESYAQKIDPKVYPVLLNDIQLEAVPAKKRVWQFITGVLRSPIDGANLDRDKACSLVLLFEKTFEQSLAHYNKAFAKAVQKDRRVIDFMESIPAIESYPAVSWVINIPSNLVVRGYRVVVGHHESVQWSGSTNRVFCLHEIGVLEKKRRKEMKAFIEQAAEAILSEMGRPEDREFVDVSRYQELMQLTKVYENEIEKPLIIQGRTVSSSSVEIGNRSNT